MCSCVCQCVREKERPIPSPWLQELSGTDFPRNTHFRAGAGEPRSRPQLTQKEHLQTDPPLALQPNTFPEIYRAIRRAPGPLWVIQAPAQTHYMWPVCATFPRGHCDGLGRRALSRKALGLSPTRPPSGLQPHSLYTGSHSPALFRRSPRKVKRGHVYSGKASLTAPSHSPPP